MKNRESFVFYDSFYKALKELNQQDKSDVIDAICEYALFNVPIDFTKHTPAGKIALILIEPQLKANIKRFEDGCKGSEFGKKGGAPKGNQNARKKQLNNPTGVEQTTPNENVNVNDNVNQNENVNLNVNDIPDKETVQTLFSPSLIFDEDIILTLNEYKRLSEVYQKSEWLKNNFKHLSKIHKYKERILTGYYYDFSETKAEKAEDESKFADYDLSEFYHG